MAFVLDVNLRIQEILGLQKVEAALSKLKGTVNTNVTGGTAGKAKSQVATLNANAVATNGVSSATDKLSALQNKGAVATKKASTAMKNASNKAGSFGESLAIAGKRYSAFVIATAVPFAAIAGFAKATAAVIEFDSAILKVRQILGQTEQEVAGLRDTILGLATSTGTSASEIANIGKVLVQAGQRGAELEDSLEALSKVPLTPSFESIDAALEGSIAAMNQFRNEGLSTTKVLDVLTAVSNKFAASSEDIAKGVSRGGAAFEAIGGTFKEFVAVFTTVRQATRESAETVGTFLKTISSRLADPKIVNFLEGKGIRISEAIEAGDPVGAIKTIAAALQNTVSIQDKIEIGTKLGGRRQISRLLALVSNIDVLNDALLTADDSAGSFGKVAEEGLKGLQAQLNILVQEMNKLVQALAEPLFVPLIQGATSLAKGFVAVLNVIKPLIPAFTLVTGFAVGFTALAFAITGVGKAAAFLASTNILSGGLPAIAGAFRGAVGGAAGGAGGGAVAGGAAGVALRGTTRERIQRRLGGGVGGSATRLGRAGRIGANVAGSNIGQLAIAASLFAVMNEASDAFKEAGNSTGILTAEFLKGAAVIALAASLLSGQSIIGAGKALVQSLGPILAGAAGLTLAFGALAFAANEAVNFDVKAIIDATAKKVSEIEVPEIASGDTETLAKAVDDLGSTAIEGLNESFNRMDSGVSGFVSDFVSSIGNLVSGEGFTEISDSQAQEMIDKIIGKNPELLNEIIRSSIEEFGIGGLEGSLDKLFTESFDGNIEAAERFRTSLINVSGGINAIASKFKDSKIQEEADKLSDAIGTAVTNFRTLRVPVAITSQLSLLSDSIGKAVKSIDRNISLFDSLSQGVGQGLSLPQLPPSDFSDKATRNIISSGQLGDFGISDELFKDISGFTADTAQVEFLLQDIVKSLLASKEESDSLGQTLSGIKVDPFEVVNEFVNKFLEETNTKLNPEAKAILVSSAGKIAKEIKDTIVKDGGLVDIDKVVGETLKKALGGSIALADAMVQSVKTFLNKSADLTAKQLQAIVIDAQIDQRTSTTPRTQANDLAANLENANLISDLKPGASFDNKAGSQFILDIGTNVDVARRAIDRMQSATQTFTQAAKDNEAAQRLGGEGAALAQKQLKLAQLELLDALKASEGVKRAAQDAPGLQQEQDQRSGIDNTRRQEEVKSVSASIVEAISRATEKAQLESAVVVSDIFKTPAQNFAEALDSSTARLKIFTKALTTEGLKAGLSSLENDATKDGRVFTTRKPVFEASERSKEGITSDAASSVALGGPTDIVGKALKDAAIAQAKSNITLFSRDRGTPRGQDVDVAGALLDAQSAKEIAEIIKRSSLSIAPILKDAANDLRTQAAAFGSKAVDRAGAQEDASLKRLIENLGSVVEDPNKIVDPKLLIPSFTSEQLKAAQNISVTPSPITTPEVGTQETASGVGKAASEVKDAANATAALTADVSTAAKEMATGVGEVVTASANILESATQLAAIVDTRREAIGVTQEAAAAGVSESSGTDEATLRNAEAIGVLGEKMVAVNNAIKEQTLQAKELASEENIEPLEIPGLAQNTTALDNNKDAIDTTNTNIGDLGTSLTSMASAIKDGVGVDVETMSEVIVDVKGVAAAAKEFTAEFEAVATKVAQAEIKVILQKLAAASGNSELAQTFESAVT